MEGSQFLRSATAPLIALSCSIQSKKIAEKNQIPDFCQFLRPFGERISSLTTQDVNGFPVTLNPCFLRFQMLDKCDPITFDFKQIIQLEGEKLPDLKTKRQVEEWRENAVLEHLTPWYHLYRALLSKYLGASEHETFNHPVGRLIVVSTSDNDPVGLVKNMIAAPLPAIFSKGYIDPVMPVFILLVHDPEDALQIDKSVENQLKQIFPTFTITLNSSPPKDTSDVPDIWAMSIAEAAPLNPPPSPTSPLKGMKSSPADIFHFRSRANSLGQLRGCRLTPNDFAGLDNFMAIFLAPKVFEFISLRIKEWERDIAAARRGLSGRLFKVGMKYFGSSKPSTQPGSFIDPQTQTVVFPYSSPEMIMRKLGDFAFMIKDYKYALSVYESVKKDFSTSEKYYKFFAGIQEMITISSILMAEGGRANYDVSYDSACQAYQDAKSPLHAARVSIWTSEGIKEHSAFREAGYSLMKMTKDEDDLKCAMFLEQSAINHLRGYPPMPRRYAFHLFLSAHRFSKAGLKEHAHRNYETAVKIYDSLGWTLIDDHINFALGKQAIQKQNFDLAVDFFMKLLHKSRQSAAIHRGYLAEFLYLYQQYAAIVEPQVLAEKMTKLPIPMLMPSTIELTLQDPRSSNRREVLNEEQLSVWDDLERKMNETMSKSNNYLPAEKSDTMRGCAVGEAFHISFEWLNPMHVPMPVNNVYLECSFGDFAPPSTEEYLKNSNSSSRIEHEYFGIELLADMALDSNEKRKVVLKLFPKKEGQIKIHGIKYLLCGIIPSFCKFEKKVKGQASAGLVLTVTPPMPVLECVFHNFPEEMLVGQVSPGTIEINNKGGKGLQNLRVMSSLQSFVYFGDATTTNQSSYIELFSESESRRHQNVQVQNNIKPETFTSLTLPHSLESTFGCLESGSTSLIPYWIRPDKIGKHVLRFIFAYQSTGSPGNYRTMRVTKTVEVTSSLRLNAFTRPSLSDLDEFVVGLEVSNTRSSFDIILRQISSLSPLWQISLVDESESVTSKLAPNETRYIYLKVSRKSGKSLDLQCTPEMLTTFAIERLVLAEDPRKLEVPELNLEIVNLASPSHVSDCSAGPFQELLSLSRNSSRIAALHQLYPSFTPEQLTELFTLYWSDDIELICFYDSPTGDFSGHVSIPNLNLSLEPPLPLAGWLSGLDSKTLAGRALFERTFQERKQLINSLLKSKMSESSPVRVMMSFAPLFKLDDDGFNMANLRSCILPVTVNVGNTSWIHEAEYEFETLSGSAKIDQDSAIFEDAPIFSWIGETKFTGRLMPNSTTSFTVHAAFSYPGVFDVNRWKLSCSLYFPKSLLDSSSSKLERVSSKFVQSPAFPQIVEIQ